MRAIRLIAQTIIIEAIRRREIYAVVVLACLLIAGTGSLRFFDIPGQSKFHSEIALMIMGLAAAVTVTVLAARQLPREFTQRTIHTLLAKPVHRAQFLIGKFLGVLGAGVFCYGIFALIFVIGSAWMGRPPHMGLFLQHLWLQTGAMAILIALAFTLSLLADMDTAVTITLLIYLLSRVMSSTVTMIYEYVGGFGQFILKILNYIIPQMHLLSLSSKVVNDDIWDPIPLGAMIALTAYAAAFTVVFLTIAWLLFRRRPL